MSKSPSLTTKKVGIPFSIILALFMIAMIIIYGFLTVYYQQLISDGVTNMPNPLNGVVHVETLIMDTVFTLLGFGLLLGSFKNSKWTGMSVALFVVSFNIILGLLFQDLWYQIFFGFRTWSVGSIGATAAPNASQFWDRHSYVGKSLASFMSFRLSNLCSTSYLVGMTAYSGRVSIQRLFFSLPIYCLLFYLNMYLNILVCFSTQNKDQSFVYFDSYGTIIVYLFGGLYGIIVGALTKTPRTVQATHQQFARKSRVSLQFSALGSLFLFATFCLSYTGIVTGLTGTIQNYRYNSQAILVMFGVSSGILGNYCTSMLVGRGRMNIQSIIMGTISGGIMVGGLADVIQNIGATLFIGWIAGAISGIFMNIITPKINAKSIVDSQGLLGPILVVAFLASFIIHPSILHQFFVRRDFYTPRGVGYPQTDFRPARYHLIYFAITLGISAITGLIIGLIYKIKRNPAFDYEDIKFFAQDYGLYTYNYGTPYIKQETHIPNQYNQQSMNYINSADNLNNPGHL